VIALTSLDQRQTELIEWLEAVANKRQGTWVPGFSSVCWETKPMRRES